MIRNVCIHVSNEQPLLADLYALPSAADAGLVCTNVRGLDGKRPVFIDDVGSTFFFPYHVIRFLEIPAGAAGGQAGLTGAAGGTEVGRPGTDAGTDAGARVDPGVDTGLAMSRMPVPVTAPDDAGGSDELDLEIDEGFLQRIRDI